MQIEIAQHARMGQTGSSLCKLIQNNSMPILDLLVRESIQNSLDAADVNLRNVGIRFIKNAFTSSCLASEFNGISDKLAARYPGSQNFIAVRDINTVGLTGPLHEGELTNSSEPHGNLIKLVYEISNAQTQEGAGGSWGLGKTIYFRVGIGLVIYYSRIKKIDGQYESRLAATLVEDESSSNALLPSPSKGFGRGIAWWGKLLNEKAIPITEENEINRILGVFKIPPYQGTETGTTIIIPYIDENKLLRDNICDKNEDGREISLPFYARSFDNYIENSVLKWYSPRLDNTKYDGQWLKAWVNENPISLKNSAPFYKIIQGLYKKALDKECGDELTDFSDDEVFIESVNTRNVLEQSSAGKIAYLKASKSQLKMIPPDNNHSPCELLNIEPDAVGDKFMNKPIIAYTRKPGMIVSFETIGAWASKIPSSNEDEFIIGLFVLNSDNRLKGNAQSDQQISLEEYVRKSELADHTSWSDHSVGHNRMRIVSSIQNKVNQVVAEKFKITPKENVDIRKTRYSSLFGDLLLPPHDFGRRPGGSQKDGSKGSDGGCQANLSGLSMKIDPSKTCYEEGRMIVEMNLVASKPHDSATIELFVDSENGCISAKKWEDEFGLNMPFSFESASMKSFKSTEKTKSDMTIKNVNVYIEKTKNNCGNILKLTVDSAIKFKANVQVVLNIIDSHKDKKPVFALNK